MCPCAKYQHERGHDSSNRQGANISYSTLKAKSSSKTDVDLLRHKRDEYAEISTEKKHELYERKKPKDDKSSINHSQKEKNASKTRHSGHTTHKHLQANINAVESKLEKGPTIRKRLQFLISCVPSLRLLRY